MSKYLNESGLGYLWGKIKGYAVKKVSSTDNAIVRFNGTDGTILNSSVTISDNGEITAGAFKIENGTSSTFLKADGSFDSNTYATDTSVVHKTGAETIPGKKTFSNGLVLNNIGSGPTDAYRNIPFSAVGAATTIQYVNTNSSTGLTYNPYTGDLKAASFTKIGGTGSQFLKADGSVDKHRYLALTVDGDIDLGDREIYASYIEGILHSTGSFISDGDIKTQGNLTVEGHVNVNGNISTESNINIGGEINASGSSAYLGEIETTGNITTSGTLTADSIYVDGGDLTVNGAIVLEGAGNGFIKANGDVDSNTYAGSQTAGGAADKAVSIPFGKLDDTSTSTVMTATIPGITELRNGVCMFLMNGKVTSASGYTININNLGAKPVYSTLAAASRTTTLFNVNYTGFFVFNEERVNGGCWDFYYGYDSNSDTIAYDIRQYNYGSLKPATACQRYQLLFTKMDGSLLPVYSGTYSTGTNKTLTTDSFNPFGQIYYYGSTTNVALMGNFPGGYLYVQATSALVNIDYSFNTKGSWTVGDLVYIVCVPQSDGSVKLHSNPIAKELPTTEDGLLYIRIGKMVDTTRCTLELHKPIYYFKDGTIRLWTGDVSEYNSKIKFNSFTSLGISPTINTEPGNYYLVEQTVTNLNIKLPTELFSNGYAADSIFVLFVTGSSTPSITITSLNSVYGESALTFAKSTRYELEFRSIPTGWVVNMQPLNLIRTLVK